MADVSETPKARLFTALWPDDALREAMATLRERWTLPKQAQSIRSERLHLTLHFIGDVERDRVDALRAGLRAVRVEPFALRLDHAEVWRNGVASLRPSEAPALLATLQQDIGAALEAAGIEPERRTWKPHVTLARRAFAAQPPSQPFALDWRGDAFVLVESRLGARGGYDVIETYSRTSATGLVPKSARSR